MPTTTPDVITVTTTWLPIAPPTVRMFAFMPVATPVWVAGTASTIRFVIAENASPMPTPASASATYTCHSALCATARNTNAQPPMKPAHDERHLRADRAP